ncbi:MAG TPA: hypothetical protein VK668_00645 [Mucilaginibacter sp.]|nr:hypothetical protein [Mucilaginibacter sp.]
MKRIFLLFFVLTAAAGCKKEQKKPTPPPANDKLLLTSIIDVNATSPDTIHIEKFTYDENFRRIKETSVNAGSEDNTILNYTYDSSGNLTSINYGSTPDGLSYTYKNDVPFTQFDRVAPGSLNNYTVSNGKVTAVAYNGSSGTMEGITYDGNNIIKVEDVIDPFDSVTITFKYGTKKDIFYSSGFKWYYGYQYPYLPLLSQNELTEQVITLPDGSILKTTYTYVYNDQGYPTQYTMYSGDGNVTGKGYYTYKTVHVN